MGLIGIWEELGIAETHDTKEIRRAYALRLRAIRGDVDPSAFRKLRAAYENALRHSDWQKQGASVAANASQEPAQALLIGTPKSAQSAPANMIDIATDGANSLASAETDALAQELATLRQTFRSNLAQRDYAEALIVYDRINARGLEPLQISQGLADELMSAAITDNTLGPEAFLNLMHRVGWNSVPQMGQRISQVRHIAYQRQEAERWYLQLQRSAAGIPETKKLVGGRLAVAIRGATVRRGTVRNARLVLGRRQRIPDIVRVSRTNAELLQRMVAQAKVYGPFLGGCIAQEDIARADRMIERERDSGYIFRRALRSICFVPALAAAIFGFSNPRYAGVIWLAIVLSWAGRFAGGLLFR